MGKLALNFQSPQVTLAGFFVSAVCPRGRRVTKLKVLAWRLGRYAGIPGFDSQHGNHVRGPAIHTYWSLYLCGSARNLFARCLCTARIGYPSFTLSQPGPAHERLDCAGLLSRKLPVLAQRTASPDHVGSPKGALLGM